MLSAGWVIFWAISNRKKEGFTHSRIGTCYSHLKQTLVRKENKRGLVIWQHHHPPEAVDNKYTDHFLKTHQGSWLQLRQRFACFPKSLSELWCPSSVVGTSPSSCILKWRSKNISTDLSWTEMHEQISILTHGLWCCLPSWNIMNILFLLWWKQQPGRKQNNDTFKVRWTVCSCCKSNKHIFIDLSLIFWALEPLRVRKISSEMTEKVLNSLLRQIYKQYDFLIIGRHIY